MAKEPYVERDLAEGVRLVSGFHGGGIGVNAVVLHVDDQALVVDCLYKPAEARRLVRGLERSGLHAVALVNTHWHMDHTIGNSLFMCPIWGQVSGTRYFRRYWPQWVGGPRDKRAQGLTLKVPDHPLTRQATLRVAGERFRLIHVPGHTSDSVGVYWPDRKVFVAGDAVMDLPFVFYGDSRKAIASLERIQALRPRLIVQGHGPPCTAGRLATDIRYLEKVRAAAREARRSGMPKKTFLQSPLDEYLPRARASELEDLYRGPHRENLEKVWNEFAGIR